MEEERHGDRRYREAHVFDFPCGLHAPERQEGDAPERQQDEILDQTLEVREVDGLPEAPAVHHRIEDHEHHGYEREQREGGEGHDGDHPAPYSGDQGYSQHGLAQSHGRTGEVGREMQEVQVEESEILVHHEPGAHGVHELQQAGDEEREAYDYGAKPSYNPHKSFLSC